MAEFGVSSVTSLFCNFQLALSAGCIPFFHPHTFPLTDFWISDMERNAFIMSSKPEQSWKGNIWWINICPFKMFFIGSYLLSNWDHLACICVKTLSEKWCMVVLPWIWIIIIIYFTFFQHFLNEKDSMFHYLPWFFSTQITTDEWIKKMHNLIADIPGEWGSSSPCLPSSAPTPGHEICRSGASLDKDLCLLSERRHQITTRL